MSLERKLSPVERFMMYRLQQGLYTCFSVAGKFDRKYLSPKLLKSLVSDLCSKWSQLVLQVYGDYQHEILRPLDKIKFSDLVEYRDDIKSVVELREVTNNLILEYGVDKPLWKIIVVGDILCFAVEHVLYDGTSGKFLLDYAGEFFDSLGDIEYADFQNEDHANDIIFDLSKVENFNINGTPADLQKEHFFPPETPASNNASEPLKCSLPAMLDKEVNCYDHYSYYYNVSAENVSKLINISRSSNVKLTSLLHTICSTALINSDILEDKNDEVFTSMIPINTRQFISDKNQEYPFGMFFGKYFRIQSSDSHPKIDLDSDLTMEKLEENKFWEQCQNFHNDLHKAVPEALYGFGEAHLACEKNDEAPLNGIKGLKSRYAVPSTVFVSSNLGLVKPKSCKQVWFDQPMVDGAFACHVISCQNGMCLTFNAHPMIKEEVYQAYVDKSIQFIEKMINLIA